MADKDTLTYTCNECGYVNVWTRDEILQRGTQIIFRDDAAASDVYSLPCKNPTIRPECPGRRRVSVPKR